MSADKFEIGLRDDSSVYKNGTWFFATLGPIAKLIISEHEIYLLLRFDKKYNGLWIDCRDIKGEKKWMLIDCSIDPAVYGGNKDKRVEYRTEPPDLTVRPSAHAIYYKNKEIYLTEAKIKWVLFADSRIYILTDEYKTRRNIHCINTEGRCLWQVEAFDNTSPDCDYYSSITCKDGRIWANSIASCNCCIDPETGKILDKVFGK